MAKLANAFLPSQAARHSLMAKLTWSECVGVSITKWPIFARENYNCVHFAKLHFHQAKLKRMGRPLKTRMHNPIDETLSLEFC